MREVGSGGGKRSDARVNVVSRHIGFAQHRVYTGNVVVPTSRKTVVTEKDKLVGPQYKGFMIKKLRTNFN